MENLLVILIVLAAAAGCGFSFLRKRKLKTGGSCASGCAGCSCDAKPATRLVTLRR